MAGAQYLVHGHLGARVQVAALLDIAIVGSLGLAVYLALARVMHIREVTAMTAMIRARLPIGR
jgi:hypothetical protein